MTDERPLYQTESREDVEYRFRALMHVVLQARQQRPACDNPVCPACILLSRRVALPETILAPGLEPREDLEAGLLKVAERIEGVGNLEDCWECPGWQYINRFRTDSGQIAEEEDKDDDADG